MDASTKLPLSGVLAVLEQTGFSQQISGPDGRILFKIPANMDLTRIDVTLSKEGYQRKERLPYNVGNNPELNNFLIDMMPIPGSRLPKGISKKYITLSDVNAIGYKSERMIEISFNITSSLDRTANITIGNLSSIMINQQYYKIGSSKFGPNPNGLSAKMPPNIPLRAILRFENIDMSIPVTSIYLFQLGIAGVDFDIANIPIYWQ